MKKVFTFAGILLTAVIFTTIIHSENLNAADRSKKDCRFKYMDQLTEEQRETIRETIRDLRSDGATPETIREKVKEMLNEYGVDIPEDADLFPRIRGHRPGRPMGKHLKNLSEEQRSALRDKIDQLHEQGASREEIHTEVLKMFKEYGMEIPADSLWRTGRGRGFPNRCPGIDLRKEQRMAIQEKVKSLRDNGADREEIHAAVKEMLEDYGFDVPEKFDRHSKKWHFLTDDQRQAVRIKIREMRESGASREEIHDAVDKMIKEFCIEQEEDNQPSGQKLETSSENFSVHSYPNPFNPETTILYTLKSPVQVTLHIYDVHDGLMPK